MSVRAVATMAAEGRTEWEIPFFMAADDVSRDGVTIYKMFEKFCDAAEEFGEIRTNFYEIVVDLLSKTAKIKNQEYESISLDDNYTMQYSGPVIRVLQDGTIQTKKRTRFLGRAKWVKTTLEWFIEHSNPFHVFARLKAKSSVWYYDANQMKKINRFMSEAAE